MGSSFAAMPPRRSLPPLIPTPFLFDVSGQVEKYRPKALDELIAHEEIITILNKLIETNKLPHLLFHGPPGTGKTSTILACARKMYGDSFKSMVLELNASDDRGIDVVRDQIKEFAGTKKLFSSGVKLVILDEADAMTNDAQSALRRVVEKYTTNTRFCMICNYVNKIIPALQSRCTRFRFAPLRADQITGRLQDVVDAERVVITEGGKTALLQLAGGDLRRVLNLLQSAAMAYPEITEEAVYLTAGAALRAGVIFLSISGFPYLWVYGMVHGNEDHRRTSRPPAVAHA
jgi:replication factor C subunit 3/5